MARRTSKPSRLRTTWDFHYWSKHVRECPFIVPVTDAEISAMRQFLQSENYEIGTRSWLSDWQSYDDIMSRDGDGNYPRMPEWYEWYDGRLGTGALLLLPDIREEKQEYYRRIGQKEEQKMHEAELLKNPPPKYVPPPPSIHCGIEQCLEFSKLADDEIFQRIFQQVLDDCNERRKAEKASACMILRRFIASFRKLPIHRR